MRTKSFELVLKWSFLKNGRPKISELWLSSFILFQSKRKLLSIRDKLLLLIPCRQQVHSPYLIVFILGYQFASSALIGRNLRFKSFSRSKRWGFAGKQRAISRCPCDVFFFFLVKEGAKTNLYLKYLHV